MLPLIPVNALLLALQGAFLVDLWDTLQGGLLLKLLLAVVLGAAIGIEREIKGKPAGLRTNILICVGAALLTDLSVWMGNVPGAKNGDPGRIAAQIVVGVGFIGAGTIMRGGGSVLGLTSAATIWVVAAIGMAVGAGRFIEATGATLLVGVVLAGLGRFEYRIRRLRRIGVCSVRCKPGTTPAVIHEVMQRNGLRVLEQDIFDHPDDRVFEMRITGPARQFDVVCDVLLATDGILGVHVA